jgi:multidrug efflux pump subunit AcrA (membrane-fusion protein)
MNKRGAAVAAGAIIIVGVVGGSILSSQREPVRRRTIPKRQESVETMSAQIGDLRTTLTITGTLNTLDRVDVYAEVTGLLMPTEKRFKPGNRFSKGEPLIRIDDGVYRNGVLAQKSTLLNQLTLLLPDLTIDFPERAESWSTYLAVFDLQRPLQPLPEAASEKERYYIASRNIYNQFYTIKGMEATLAKYTIRAPYDGVVTASDINPGALVRQGQKLGEFASTNTYEMEAFADLGEIRRLSAGMPATLTCRDLPGEFPGTVSRINEVIDRHTQTVAVYITTTDDRLRDGLYMTASIESAPIPGAARVPSSALVGDSQVWVVRDSALAREDVTVAAVEGDWVVVQGLAAGMHVVVKPPDEAFDGMAIPGSAALDARSTRSTDAPQAAVDTTGDGGSAGEEVREQ